MAIWESATTTKAPKIALAPAPKISSTPTKSSISTKGLYKAPGSVLGPSFTPSMTSNYYTGNAGGMGGGTPQYSGYLGPTSDPWKLINQDVAKKLQSRGVTVVPTPGYGAGTPTAGTFFPSNNRIVYDPTRAGSAGTLQGEFVHAATANLPLRSSNQIENLRLRAIRGVYQGDLRSLPFLIGKDKSPFFSWSEGLAHRSGYGNYWGQSIRDYVVPNPL